MPEERAGLELQTGSGSWTRGQGHTRVSMHCVPIGCRLKAPKPTSLPAGGLRGRAAAGRGAGCHALHMPAAAPTAAGASAASTPGKRIQPNSPTFTNPRPTSAAQARKPISMRWRGLSWQRLKPWTWHHCPPLRCLRLPVTSGGSYFGDPAPAAGAGARERGGRRHPGPS